MKKRNKYILLIILCVSTICIIENLYLKRPSPTSGISLSFDPNELNLTSQQTSILSAMVLFYMLIFITGIINIISFIVAKVKRILWLDASEKKQNFPLIELETLKTFFWVILLTLSTYAIGLGTQFVNIEPNRVIFLLLLNLLLELGIITIVTKKLKIKFLNFRIKENHIKDIFKIYTAIVPLTALLLIINIALATKMGFEPNFNPAVELLLFIKNKFSLIILALQIILIGPLAEELLFRGLLYNALRKDRSFIASATVSSLFFSIIHRTPHNILPLFLISLGLCYLYEKSQNILAPILLHSLYNTINFIFLIALKTVV